MVQGFNAKKEDIPGSIDSKLSSRTNTDQVRDKLRPRKENRSLSVSGSGAGHENGEPPFGSPAQDKETESHPFGSPAQDAEEESPPFGSPPKDAETDSPPFGCPLHDTMAPFHLNNPANDNSQQLDANSTLQRHVLPVESEFTRLQKLTSSSSIWSSTTDHPVTLKRKDIN